MPLKLLQHKSWHVYSAENVARVQRDEAAAQLVTEESDRRMALADSEARLDRMRKKSRKRERGDKDEGEEMMERQLRGEKRVAGQEQQEEESGTRIIRPDSKGKGKDVLPVRSGETNGHVNFWADLEAGSQPTAELQTKLQRAIETEKEESFTKVYLAKRGETELLKGWYASQDGKTEKERKEGVEVTLEKAYKDGEQKRLTDPLATMNAFLQRRTEVLSGHAPRSSSGPSNRRERYITPATPASERGDLSPVITSLLAPRRRRGDPLPPPPPAPASSAPRPSSSSTTRQDPTQEATTRITSERARAAALIAAKRRELTSSSSRASSVASTTPRSEAGGSGMFNAEATREARERREMERGHAGWGEQRRRREERERERGGWGRR